MESRSHSFCCIRFSDFGYQGSLVQIAVSAYEPFFLREAAPHQARCELIRSVICVLKAVKSILVCHSTERRG